MKKIWSDYLEQVLPLNLIDKLVVYTDQFRYWLTDGLLQLGEENHWQTSMTSLDELTDEETIEIQDSLSLLTDSTLLVGFFSSYNIELEKINRIFNPFTPPTDFQGYSLICQNRFPDQYFIPFLEENYHTIQEREEDYRTILNSSPFIMESDNGTYLETEVSDFTTYPFTGESGRHILIPSTEIVAAVENIEGTFVVDRTVGEIYAREELTDPLGHPHANLSFLIEESKVVDIQGPKAWIRRCESFMNQSITTLTLGLSTYREPIGLLEVDRLSYKTITIGNPDKSIDLNGGPVSFS